jgi:hypothetical protein
MVYDRNKNSHDNTHTPAGVPVPVVTPIKSLSVAEL